MPTVYEVSTMGNYLDGSWEKLSSGSEIPSGWTFAGAVRPMDKRSNREMLAERVQNDIKENNGGYSREKCIH